MTLEEARALPLRSMFKTNTIINEDGVTMHVREVGAIHVRHIAEDDILWFRDADSRLMYIGEDDEGLYKYAL